jgi:hypothetical protein
MNFLTNPGTLTTRVQTLLALVALVAGLAVPAILTTPAHASDVKVAHSTTTMALKAIFGAHNVKPLSGKVPTSNRSETSDVYHVSTSYIDKKQHQCRRIFHKRHKRRICVKAQTARGVQTRYFVTHYRMKNFWNKHVKFKHLAKWCRHHHKRCVKRYPHLYCGPLSGTGATYIAACLSRRSQYFYGKWMNLKFYHNHTVPSATTDTLRLANATYAVIIRDWDWFGGPNTIIKFSRTATVDAYHNVWAADTALAAANGLCVAAGVAGRSSQLAIACSALASATIGKLKSDLSNAYNEGKCLQLKYYDIYNVGPVPNVRNAFPSSVTDCVSSKLARRR